MDAVISFGKGGPVFHINRVAFSIGNIEVYWYGLIIGLAILVGVCLALAEIKKTDLTLDDFLNMFLIGVPVAIVCARLYYVIFSWDMYKDNPLEIFNLRGGGIAIYGAILGGLLAMFIVSKVKKASFFEVIDYFAPAVMIGQICGRWGNFFNAEAFGLLEKINFPFIGDIATPFFENNYIFRMVIENARVGVIEVHPTFLYESLWNLSGLILIHFLFNHKKFDGEIAALYFSWYGFGRFFIEGLRTDSLMSGSFRFSQLLGGIFAIAGVVFIIIGRNIAKKKTNNLDKCVKCFEDDSEMEIPDQNETDKGE